MVRYYFPGQGARFRTLEVPSPACKRDLLEKGNLRDTVANAIKNHPEFLKNYDFKKRRTGAGSCPAGSI